MADDRDKDRRRASEGEATVQIPAELLSILPPPAEPAAPPPPPPGPRPAAAPAADQTAALPPAPPPPPPAADPAPPPPPRGSYDDDRRGGGAVWLIAALVVVVLFVAVCYLVVAQAEGDRPRSATPAETTAPPTSEATTTTAPTPSTQDPASLAVVVLNGTSQRGWAGENVARLAEAGYTGEASDAAQETDITTVYVAEEALRADGTAIATAVGLPDAPVEIRPDTPLGVTDAADGADVVVVLGADSTG